MNMEQCIGEYNLHSECKNGCKIKAACKKKHDKLNKKIKEEEIKNRVTVLKTPIEKDFKEHQKKAAKWDKVIELRLEERTCHERIRQIAQEQSKLYGDTKKYKG